MPFIDADEVNIELFEGPVELLLYLARKNEVDIFEVPIGRLTDDFLEYVQSASRLNIEKTSDFLVMAAVLLRLKMRRLLPRPREEELDTPTVTLDQILDEFRRFQQAALALSDRESERRQLFPRQATTPRRQLADAGEVDVLTAALRRVLSRVRPERLVEVAPRRIRFEDKLVELRRLLRQHGTTRFEDAIAGSTVAEIITLFIAVLELVRLGEILVRQDSQFETITLELRPASTTESS